MIAFHTTATLELAYTKGHHHPAEVEREVSALSTAFDGGEVEPQHGYQPIREPPGREILVAAPFCKGAFLVTWMGRRKC